MSPWYGVLLPLTVSFRAFLRSLIGLSPECAYCGSRNIRRSRGRYGLILHALGVAASRCRVCKRRFPLPWWVANSLPEPEPDE